jgi:cobalt-zinc-cadmium efflux system membrane fusion protein
MIKQTIDLMKSQTYQSPESRSAVESGRVLFMLFLVALMSVGCGDSQEKSSPSAATEAQVGSGNPGDTLVLNAQQMANGGIVVGAVGRADVNTELQLMGQLEASPQSRVSVGSLVGGMVKKISVKSGDVVRAGQLLCAIENLQVIDWQEAYLTAEAEGVMLGQEAERQKELYQAKASSLKNYQQAEALMKMNRAKQEALLQRLASVGIGKEQLKKGIQRWISVKASVGGVVESVLVHEGMTVADNANLMEVLSNAGAQWVLSGYEGQTGLVKVGMSVELSPAEGGASSEIVGRVAAVSPSIQSDRTWKIYCVPVNNADSKVSLRVGQAIRGKIAVQSNGAFVLPESAVFQRDGKYFCFTQSGGPGSTTFLLTPIVVIGQHEQSVVLSNPPSQPVVTQGAYSLWMMWDAKQSAEE